MAFIIQNLEDKDNNKDNLNNNDTTEIIGLNNSSNLINSINLNNNENIERYELFLHNDTNTLGYTQWFFFRISNVKKGKTLNFNIMNFLRKTTKYSNGMKIWVYSRKN